MNVAGIVAEYNPFHRGHAWHLAETRRLLGADAGIVCVMSGHWVQGADCAVSDKWTRAALALAGGADLVLELPTVWAVSSAECFARGAVSLLAGTGVVTHLSFGSEAGALPVLEGAAACLDAPEYRAGLRRLVDGGMPFAAARQAAVRGLLGDGADCLSTPNNNLGVEYLRALNALGSAITPLTVARRSVGHGKAAPAGGFASATAIRGLLRSGQSAQAAPYLEPGALERLGGDYSDLYLCERAVLARLRAMHPADWAALPDGGGAEGLPTRLCRAAAEAVSLEEFFALAKTRRYTHARLRRLALWAFLGLEEADRPAAPPYLRVLGANRTGRALLREMDGAAALPVVTKPAHAKRLPPAALALFELEARCTDLYGLCRAQIRPCGLEWTTGPVMA